MWPVTDLKSHVQSFSPEGCTHHDTPVRSGFPWVFETVEWVCSCVLEWDQDLGILHFLCFSCQLYWFIDFLWGCGEKLMDVCKVLWYPGPAHWCINELHNCYYSTLRHFKVLYHSTLRLPFLTAFLGFVAPYLEREWFFLRSNLCPHF